MIIPPRQLSFQCQSWASGIRAPTSNVLTLDMVTLVVTVMAGYHTLGQEDVVSPTPACTGRTPEAIR